MFKIDSSISGEVSKYDFVIVSIDGHLILGFLFSETDTTIQFIGMDDLINFDTRKVLKFQKPYIRFILKNKRYVVSLRYKICKYSPDLLSIEEREKYDKAVELMEVVRSYQKD